MGPTHSTEASKIGVTAAAVSRYELGQRELSLDTAERIALALGVHIFDLVGISDELGKYQVKFDRIVLSGHPEDLTPEKIAEVEKILSADPKEDFDDLPDKDKADFWSKIAQAGVALDINSPRARINAALDQLPKEGQEKVADYAEDILPRYHRQEALPNG